MRLSSSLSSVFSINLLSSKLTNIFYAVLNNVISLWLLQLSLSHFLQTGQIIPSFHCCGNCSLFHIIRTNLCSFCFSVLPPCLSNSGSILSEPTALFSFKLLIIKHISLYDGSGICG